MPDDTLTTVQIKQSILRKLGDLAERDKRSKAAQLEWMIELAYARTFADIEHLVADPDQLPLPLEE